MSNIVILGGGSAGWMTALFLNKMNPSINITVIEDPTIPPIIAGESAGSNFSRFLYLLDINIDDWIKSTNAMPKLGGRLNDWSGIGTMFIHGLIEQGRYSADFYKKYLDIIGSKLDFLKCVMSENISFEHIFYNSQAIRHNKISIANITRTISGVDPILNNISEPMWHFDSRANAVYLKNIGISKNIRLVEGTYQSASRADNGNITSLVLKDGTSIDGDWFFDCSGFSRLLLHKELNVKMNDLTRYFPAREVVAWWEDTPVLKTCTEITAMEYGWSWEINLNHRKGCGYVYDPDHISLDQAIHEAELRFEKKIKPVANFLFTPSIAENAWEHNVIGIGISSGFLEPLESNGLGQIIIQLTLLEKFWNPGPAVDYNRTMYNRQYNAGMNDILNFLLLHYKGHRRDTDFWKSHAYDEYRFTDELTNNLQAWRNGIFLNHTQESGLGLYPLESYATVIQGLDLIDSKKLKHLLLLRNSNIINDFYDSYAKLQTTNSAVINDCMSIEQWRNIFYGRTSNVK